MAHHNHTGKQGELLAVAYFQKKGFEVLYQNWRHKNWEIDLVAVHGAILHFIEVKTRRTKTFGHPEDGADKKKIRNLINAAEEFLYQYPEWKRIQFDILSISLIPGEPEEYFLIEDVYL